VDLTAIAVSLSGEVFAATRNHIFHSTDRGELWDTTSTQSIDNSGQIAVLTFDATGDILAGVQKTTATTSGVYRLRITGTYWSIDTLGLIASVRAMVVNTNGTIYAGGDNGAFRSTDNGKTWSDISSGLIVRTITSLAIDREGHLLAGLAEGSVVRSSERVEIPATVDNTVGNTTLSSTSAFWIGSGFSSGQIPIHFPLSRTEHVAIDILTSDGRYIARLLDDELNAGTHQVVWNASAMASGPYFCRIIQGQRSTLLPVIIAR
jgi:ligand-binding sensor domain-containing protein